MNRMKKLWQRGRERFGGRVELQMPGRALLWRREVVCSGCEQIIGINFADRIVFLRPSLEVETSFHDNNFIKH